MDVRNPSILLVVAILLHTSGISSECIVMQVFRGTLQYRCHTIQELQEKGNSSMTDVSVYDDPLGTTLRSSVFQKIPNVESLSIRRSISVIRPGTFDSLEYLIELSVDYNPDFRQIEKGVFSNLKLQRLDLQGNTLLSIEPGAFSNLTRLKTINLSRNQMSRIKKGIFNEMFVEILRLSRNVIRYVEEGAFNDMPNLKRLHLDGNLLSEFQTASLLNHGHVLQILWLHNNSFTEIGRNTLKSLDNLALVNFEDNKISKIQPYAFESSPNLSDLVLSNNSLTELDSDAFPDSGMSKLAKLYIDNNLLLYLNLKTLEKLPELKSVRIGGNPWLCPCLDLFMLWFNEHGVKQPCDKDYFGGAKPICVVSDNSPHTCTYSYDRASVQRYAETHGGLPKSARCVL